MSGARHQRAGEGDPLGLTARQLARAAFPEALEAEPVQQGTRAGDRLPSPDRPISSGSAMLSVTVNSGTS